VQLVLPLLSQGDRSLRALSIRGRTYQVQIARHRRARRYLLRVRRDGVLRLTVPYGAAIHAALKFAEQQGPWIERERARQDRRAAPWRDGASIFFRGTQEQLRVEGAHVWCGHERMAVTTSTSDLRDSIERHCRALAARELPPRCLELAGHHGVAIHRVVVRNQRSRWGSCSPKGVIALNWRLVQMPPGVSDYVLLHELMHMRQHNHSRRFWREVESVCPAWRESEKWLRTHGAELL
jgi:predicted metal-dependent hydrolase